MIELQIYHDKPKFIPMPVHPPEGTLIRERLSDSSLLLNHADIRFFGTLNLNPAVAVIEFYDHHAMLVTRSKLARIHLKANNRELGE
jgi:hypothetical protein